MVRNCSVFINSVLCPLLQLLEPILYSKLKMLLHTAKPLSSGMQTLDNWNNSRNRMCSHNLSRLLHTLPHPFQEVALQKINCILLKTRESNLFDTSRELSGHIYHLYRFSQKIYWEQEIKNYLIFYKNLSVFKVPQLLGLT